MMEHIRNIHRKRFKLYKVEQRREEKNIIEVKKKNRTRAQQTNIIALHYTLQ